MTSLANFHHLNKVLKLIFILSFFDDRKFHFFYLLTWMGILFDEIMNDWFRVIDVAARVTSAWTVFLAECIVGVKRGLR